MENVSGFLKRFTHLIHHKEYTIEVVLEVLNETLQTTFSKDDVRIRNKVATVRASGGTKAQLFIHKKGVIEEVNKKLGKTILTDIR